MRPEACNPFLAERKHVIFKNIQGKILGGFLGWYEHIFQLGRDADYICVVSGGKYLSPPPFFCSDDGRVPHFRPFNREWRTQSTT
jgi:hypothetical protein